MTIRLFKKTDPMEALKQENIRFLHDVAMSRLHTSDMRNLEFQLDHFLAVADETQEDHHGYGNLNFLEKLDYDVFTQHPVMMLKEDLGVQSHPLIFNTTLRYQNPPPFIPVKCELFRVAPEHILKLDKYKQNGIAFERKKILLVIPYTQLWFKDRSIAQNLFGKEHSPHRSTGMSADTVSKALLKKRGVYRVWGWMYFAKPQFWENIISITDRHPPVRTFTNPDGVVKEYYKFTDAEYNIERHNL